MIRLLVLLSAASLVVGCSATLPFDERFESATWYEAWGRDDSPEHCDLVASETVGDDAIRLLTEETVLERMVEPRPSGQVLRVRIPKDSHYGVGDLAFRFRQQVGVEPTEAYLAYDLQLGADWKTEVSGKLPGIAGTYGVGGWGGRRSDGLNGWSARGMFRPAANGSVPIGTYGYHVDQRRIYGSHWNWEREGQSGLIPGRWYRIEQYCRLNTPGQHNGVIRGWINGVSAFEILDVRFRDTDALKVETVWMDVYHGGKQPAPNDLELFIDNVLIALRPPTAGKP